MTYIDLSNSLHAAGQYQKAISAVCALALQGRHRPLFGGSSGETIGLLSLSRRFCIALVLFLLVPRMRTSGEATGIGLPSGRVLGAFVISSILVS